MDRIEGSGVSTLRDPLPRVLLIGLPEELRRGLEHRLGQAGCNVEARPARLTAATLARSVKAGAILAYAERAASMVLALRRVTLAPLVVITSAAEAERVAALTNGADLCLRESEDEPLIVAHVLGLLRRSGASPGGGLQMGRVLLDPAAHRAEIAGLTLDLRPREFELLLTLMRSPGHVFRRDELLEKVWGMGEGGKTNTIDVHVSRLRHLLPRGCGVRITTLRGIGYRLDDEANSTA